MSGVLLSVGRLRDPAIQARRRSGGRARASPSAFCWRSGSCRWRVAAAFLWTPTNYKRMLAYSSVEHIGLVCLGLGFGGAWGVAGALLHIANHALAKSDRSSCSPGGSAPRTARRRSRRCAACCAAHAADREPPFLAAMLALMGLPPFGLFVSEVMILGAGFRKGPIVARPRSACCCRRRLRRAAARRPSAMLYGEPAGPATDGARPRAWRASSPVAARAPPARADRPRLAAGPRRRARPDRGRSWGPEMAPGAARDAGAGPAARRARARSRPAARIRSRAAGRRSRRSRRWPSASPTLGAQLPAPGRRRHARERSGDFTLVYVFAPPTLPAAGLTVLVRRSRPPTRAFLAGDALVRGEPLRARDPRPPRPRPRRPSRISGASRSTSTGRTATIRCAATRWRARDFADAGQPFPFRRVEGEGHLRDHRRPRPRRHHRARPLPLQRRGRDDRQPRDAAGLRPQGHGEALRDAAFRADAGRWPSGSRATRASATPSPTARRSRRWPAATVPPRAARWLRVDAPRARAALQPRRRRGHDRQRHGLRLRPRALLPHPRGAAAAERAR